MGLSVRVSAPRDLVCFGQRTFGSLYSALIGKPLYNSPEATSGQACDSSPEYVRIKSFSGSGQSLSSFYLQSDPSQNYLLSTLVASIGAGQTLEFQSGTGAVDNPSAGIYKLTGSFIYRNGDPIDYARLARSGA